jgi:hypothetical protein
MQGYRNGVPMQSELTPVDEAKLAILSPADPAPADGQMLAFDEGDTLYIATDPGTGLTWRAAWNPATAYAIRDAVYYAGCAWYAIAAGTNQNPVTAAGFWSLLASGVAYSGAWAPGAYTKNSIVQYLGSAWISTTAAVVGDIPGSAPAVWSLLAEKGDDGLLWQGAWDIAEVYIQDDAVYHSGSTWVANATTVAGEEPGVSAKWDLAARGVIWQGSWVEGTTYAGNDLVERFGSAYVSIQDNNTGQDPVTETAYWALAARGFCWRGAYGAGTQYYAYDFVSYLGSSWRALKATLGNDPAEGEFWTIVAQKGSDGTVGMTWQGTWIAQGYVATDGVQYNGSAWRASEATAAGEVPGVSAKWQLVSRGLNWMGTWAIGTQYRTGDVVEWASCTWYALQDNLAVEPVAGINWSLMSSGIKWQGAYGGAVQYRTNDLVSYLGSTWRAVQDTLGNEPVEGANWTLVAQKGATGDPGATGAVGVVWEGAWNIGTTYHVRDAVLYNSSAWYATIENTAEAPGSGASWSLLARGLYWRGAYAGGTTYATNDLVTSGGSAYASLLDGNTGQDPATQPGWWSLVASKGDTGAAGAAGAPGPMGPVLAAAVTWDMATPYIVARWKVSGTDTLYTIHANGRIATAGIVGIVELFDVDSVTPDVPIGTVNTFTTVADDHTDDVTLVIGNNIKLTIRVTGGGGYGSGDYVTASISLAKTTP